MEAYVEIDAGGSQQVRWFVRVLDKWNVEKKPLRASQRTCWSWIFVTYFIIRVNHVVLYGSETWTMRKVDSDRIQSFHMQALRRILGIRWYCGDSVRHDILTFISLVSVGVNLTD